MTEKSFCLRRIINKDILRRQHGETIYQTGRKCFKIGKDNGQILRTQLYWHRTSSGRSFERAGRYGGQGAGRVSCRRRKTHGTDQPVNCTCAGRSCRKRAKRTGIQSEIKKDSGASTGRCTEHGQYMRNRTYPSCTSERDRLCRNQTFIYHGRKYSETVFCDPDSHGI